MGQHVSFFSLFSVAEGELLLFFGELKSHPSSLEMVKEEGSRREPLNPTPRTMSASVSSPLRKAVATCLLPSLGGAALAALCIMSFVAFDTAVHGGSRGSLSVLGESPAQSEDQATAHMGLKDLVQSATAHTQGAMIEAKRAAALRQEAATAKSKVAGLKAQLHELLTKESESKKMAASAELKANQLALHARKAAIVTDSIESARNAALAAAKAKRQAFLSDERLAGQNKAAAASLLDRERELFQKSEKRINREVKMQAKAKRERQTLAELRREKRRAGDHVAILKMRSHTHATAAPAPSKPAAVDDAAKYKHNPLKHDSIKRPLWGEHKWPSYYKNVLTEKKLFSADAPSHPPTFLDRGDDDKSMEQGHIPHAQRCTMDRPCGRSTGVNGFVAPKPARTQAMYQQEQQAQQQQQPQQARTDAATQQILARFEGDVAKMEAPLVGMEQQLQAQYKKDAILRAHERVKRKFGCAHALCVVSSSCLLSTPFFGFWCFGLVLRWGLVRPGRRSGCGARPRRPSCRCAMFSTKERARRCPVLILCRVLCRYELAMPCLVLACSERCYECARQCAVVTWGMALKGAREGGR